MTIIYVDNHVIVNRCWSTVRLLSNNRF